MQFPGLVVRLLMVAALALLLEAAPASSRRIVFDVDTNISVDGYCSPNSCTGFTTPFSVPIGSTSYNSFYANSNGTLSFGSIFSPYLMAETPTVPDPYFIGPPSVTDLTAYPVPIFSPNFVDGPGFDNPDTLSLGIFDGAFVAKTSVDANSFTTSFYTCDHPQICGLTSVDLVRNAVFNPDALEPGGFESLIMANSTATCPCTLEEVFASGQQNLENYLLTHFPLYTLTLTKLDDGFRVDYSYNQGSTGQIGTYGFSLPTGADQATGPLANRSYLFDSLGQLVAVPEPQTWLTLLFGFGAMGLALRRTRGRQIRPA